MGYAKLSLNIITSFTQQDSKYSDSRLLVKEVVHVYSASLFNGVGERLRIASGFTILLWED